MVFSKGEIKKNGGGQYRMSDARLPSCHRAAAVLQITGVYRVGGGGSAGGGGWWDGWLLAPHHRL